MFILTKIIETKATWVSKIIPPLTGAGLAFVEYSLDKSNALVFQSKALADNANGLYNLECDVCED
jgi:hypothetical protein